MFGSRFARGLAAALALTASMAGLSSTRVVDEGWERRLSAPGPYPKPSPVARHRWRGGSTSNNPPGTRKHRSRTTFLSRRDIKGDGAVPFLPNVPGHRWQGGWLVKHNGDLVMQVSEFLRRREDRRAASHALAY